MAASPSPRPVRPSPSVVVPATVTGAPIAVDKHGLRLGATGADLRGDTDDLDRYVADLETGGAHPIRRLSEQSHTGRTGPFGARGAEIGTEIAEAGGGKKRIACGMGGHITIGMTGQPALAWPQQPGDPAWAVGEGVHVRADPDPRSDHDPRVVAAESVPSSRSSATARSAGRVIFMAASAPGTQNTGTPIASARPASSVR